MSVLKLCSSRHAHRSRLSDQIGCPQELGLRELVTRTRVTRNWLRELVTRRETPWKRGEDKTVSHPIHRKVLGPVGECPLIDELRSSSAKWRINHRGLEGRRNRELNRPGVCPNHAHNRNWISGTREGPTGVGHLTNEGVGVSEVGICTTEHNGKNPMNKS